MRSTISETLYRMARARRPGFMVLLDPEKADPESERTRMLAGEDSPADFILVGTSNQAFDNLDDWLVRFKPLARRPIVIFPGSARQLSGHAHAVLFLALLSGRNPDYLIGQQVQAAAVLRSLGLEAIGTAYILVRSDSRSSAEVASSTVGLPRDAVENLVWHALAGQYLGMRIVYLDAGSGSSRPLPVEAVEAVSTALSIPLVVGGGVRKPQEAELLVRAGADFIVVGNALEEGDAYGLASEISAAVNEAGRGGNPLGYSLNGGGWRR